MAVEIDYRGVVQPVRSIPEAEQRELIGKYQPSAVYVLGTEATQDTIAKQQRPPRAVVVSDAALLGEKRGGKTERFDSFLWLKNEIHRPGRGGFILEARTGRRSDRPKDWLAMRRDAERMCGRLAQGASSALNAKKGAKPFVPTRDELQAMRAEWYDVRHATVDDAVAAIKKRLGKRAPGRTKIYEILGSPYERRES